MHASSQRIIGPALIIVCVRIVVAAGVYRLAALGSCWAVPGAGVRAAAELATALTEWEGARDLAEARCAHRVIQTTERERAVLDGL